MPVLGCNLKNDRVISVCFQGKPFNIMVIQVYAPITNAEEVEVEWFYEDLQDILELTPPKDLLFIIGDCNAKVGSQEIPGVTGKFSLGVQNEAGQRIIGLLGQQPEKAMAPHSSTLAWKIPWTEGPGGLQSMGSLGIGHD